MDITPLIPEGLKIITRYGDGGFTINETRVDGAILLSPHHVFPSTLLTVETITEEALRPLFEAFSPHLLLIGCGTTHFPTPPVLQQHLRSQGISVETMTTGAACRTYNILLSEGRDVAAVLLPV